MIRGAAISDDGLYRYRLWRIWDAKLARACFVMLNPSTADADVDDPTIRRCIGFAQRGGYGGLEVVNLFAWRATKPANMWARYLAGKDIAGPLNHDHCVVAFRNSALVVCAWGCVSDRPVSSMAATAMRTTMQSVGRGPHVLGLTMGGDPRHPLYMPNAAEPTLWAAP